MSNKKNLAQYLDLISFHLKRQICHVICECEYIFVYGYFDKLINNFIKAMQIEIDCYNFRRMYNVHVLYTMLHLPKYLYINDCKISPPTVYSIICARDIYMPPSICVSVFGNVFQGQLILAGSSNCYPILFIANFQDTFRSVDLFHTKTTNDIFCFAFGSM